MQIKLQLGKLKLNLPLADRLLIAQANVEQVVLLSNDPEIAKHPVNVQW
jgi:PIN domain nuclease of toxin-antitoxin system